MDPTRNITGDFGPNVLVSGINVAVDGQRRDHIIYSKGYNNLNIYGNYFEGMENGAAGGVKIRNGKNAYVGSNHFKDVPVLAYIYGDLTKEECVLYNTTIYNNLFHQTTNFGGQGTGILYYQSYRDGDTLEFKVTNPDGTTGKEPWANAFGDVQNFVIYKNQFLSDDRDQITISNRAEKAFKDNQFIASENRYVEKDTLVGYNKGNFVLGESTENKALSKVNDSYNKYKDVEIPLTPATVDHSKINIEIDKAKEFYNEILNNDLIGILGGQHPQEVVDELLDLIADTEDLINKGQLNQWDTNTRLTLIQKTIEKVQATVNSKGDAPEVTGLDRVIIKAGEEFDSMKDLIITDDRDTIDQLKVTVDKGNFDNTKVGTYIIKYTIEDRDGNIAEAEREVTVVSNKPSITGIDSVTIKVGEEFDPMAGVTITDDFDTIDQLKVTVDKGDFDNTKAGTYIIKYVVEDSDKNVTVVERTVIVEEKRVDVIEDTTNNKPNKPNTHNSDKDTSKNEINNSQNPNTGDKSNVLKLSLIGITAIAGLVLLNRRKKK